MDSTLMPIGRFAALARLTVRAVRHYDDLGLLRPRSVDPLTGYRHYATDQLATAAAISLLRSVDMPLEAIRELLDAPDSRPAVLERHRALLADRLASANRLIDVVDRLIEKGGAMPYEVTIVELQPVHAILLPIDGNAGEVGRIIPEIHQELRADLRRAGVDPSGDPFIIVGPGGIEHAQIGWPVAEPVATEGRGVITLLPGGRAARTLHIGPYGPEVTLAYQTVATWLREHELLASHHPREVYVLAAEEADDPSKFETEVIWPIVE